MTLKPAVGWAVAALFFITTLSLIPLGPTRTPLVLTLTGSPAIEAPDVPRRMSISEPQIRSLVDDGQTFPRDHLTLEWDLMRWESSGPARYDVYVMTVGLEDIFVARSLDIAELQVPEEALSDLAPGATVLWQVEAYLSDGKSVKSPTYLALLEHE